MNQSLDQNLSSIGCLVAEKSLCGGGGWHIRIESLQVLLTFDFWLLTWTWTWIVSDSLPILSLLSFVVCINSNKAWVEFKIITKTLKCLWRRDNKFQVVQVILWFTLASVIFIKHFKFLPQKPNLFQCSFSETEMGQSEFIENEKRKSFFTLS